MKDLRFLSPKAKYDPSLALATGKALLHRKAAGKVRHAWLHSMTGVTTPLTFDPRPRGSRAGYVGDGREKKKKAIINAREGTIIDRHLAMLFLSLTHSRLPRTVSPSYFHSSISPCVNKALYPAIH